MKTLLVSTVEHAGQFTRQATTAVLVHETTPGKTAKYLSVSNFLMTCVLYFILVLLHVRRIHFISSLMKMQ